MTEIFKQLYLAGYSTQDCIHGAAILAAYHRENREKWEDSRSAGYHPADAWASVGGWKVCGPHANWGDYEYDTILIDGFQYAVM